MHVKPGASAEKAVALPSSLAACLISQPRKAYWMLFLACCWSVYREILAFVLDKRISHLDRFNYSF